MKAVTRVKFPKDPPLEERFQKFAKALMAVPKKELDKELAKFEKRGNSKRTKSQLKT